MGFRGNTGRNYLVAQAFQPVRWNRLKPVPPENSRGRLFHIFSFESWRLGVRHCHLLMNLQKKEKFFEFPFGPYLIIAFFPYYPYLYNKIFAIIAWTNKI
jgi:hypothetical protein